MLAVDHRVMDRTEPKPSAVAQMRTGELLKMGSDGFWSRISFFSLFRVCSLQLTLKTKLMPFKGVATNGSSEKGRIVTPVEVGKSEGMKKERRG